MASLSGRRSGFVSAVALGLVAALGGPAVAANPPVTAKPPVTTTPPPVTTTPPPLTATPPVTTKAPVAEETAEASGQPKPETRPEAKAASTPEDKFEGKPPQGKLDDSARAGKTSRTSKADSTAAGGPKGAGVARKSGGARAKDEGAPTRGNPSRSKPKASEAAAAPAAAPAPTPTSTLLEDSSPASPPPMTMTGLQEEIRREGSPGPIDPGASGRTKVEQMLAEIAKTRQALKDATSKLEAMMTESPDAAPPAPAGAAGPAAAASGKPVKNPLDVLAKALRAIKPESAAPIVARLDKRLAATVLLRMPPVDAGKIMGALKPDTAAELATQIAMRTPNGEVKR